MVEGGTETDRPAALIDMIDRLDPRDLRLLRKTAGSDKESHPEAVQIIDQILPADIPKADENHYFYAVALAAACKPAKEGAGSFGAALGKTDRHKNGGQFADYLASVLDLQEIRYLSSQLARGVRYLNLQKVSLDRAQLVRDLLAWKHADRAVQVRWAKDYARARSTPETPPDDPVQGYFDAVGKLNEAQKAALQACISVPLHQAPGEVLILFYSVLPEKVAESDELLYYQAAVLNALNDEPCAPQKNIGAALHAMRTKDNESALFNLIQELIASRLDEIYPLLVKTITLLKKVRIGYCPERLLNDLLFWDHPARTVQDAWLNAFNGPDTPRWSSRTIRQE